MDFFLPWISAHVETIETVNLRYVLGRVEVTKSVELHSPYRDRGPTARRPFPLVSAYLVHIFPRGLRTAKSIIEFEANPAEYCMGTF
jgi:hypothetical protein